MDNKQHKLKTLYSSQKQDIIVDAIELPEKWASLSLEELRTKAREAILELSKSSNTDFKAKELGFNDVNHLMSLCFDFILK